MKYHITMLCGGESMMLTPSEIYRLDLEDAVGKMDDEILRSNKDMVEFMHKGVKLTLYTNGSIMFYHFTDLEVAYAYADEVLEIAKGGRKEV